MNRRSFFQGALTAIGTVAILPVVARAARDAKPAAGAGPVMVDPKDQTAKAVQYVEKSTKPGQTCASCVLYNMDGKETTFNKQKVGACSLFPGKHVYADGWCASYAKKG